MYQYTSSDFKNAPRVLVKAYRGNKSFHSYLRRSGYAICETHHLPFSMYASLQFRGHLSAEICTNRIVYNLFRCGSLIAYSQVLYGSEPHTSRYCTATILDDMREIFFSDVLKYEIANQILSSSLRMARLSDLFQNLLRAEQDSILRKVWWQVFLLNLAYWPIDMTQFLK